MKQQTLSLKGALFWIFFSTMLVSGSAFAAFFYWKHLEEKRLHDPKYEIQKISVNQSLLPISLIKETLQIQGKNLYAVNLAKIEMTLKQIPLIESVSAARMPPNTLSIQYIPRKPVAVVMGRPNIAIDLHGAWFPLSPYYSNKDLPSIDFGETPDEKQMELVRAILQSCPSIETIDLTRLEEKSLGKCFIAVVLKNKKTLKFYPEQVKDVFRRYRLLAGNLPNEPMTIDFRIEGMGLVE